MWGEEVAFGGRRNGLTPHEGILALQRGEDVKIPVNSQAPSKSEQSSQVIVVNGFPEAVHCKW